MPEDPNTRDLELLLAVAEGEAGALNRLVLRIAPVVRVEVARGIGRARSRTSEDAAGLTNEALWMLVMNDARELQRWDPQRGLTLDSFARLIVRRFTTRKLSKTTPTLVEPQWFDEFGVDSAGSTLETADEIARVLAELNLQGRDRELFDRLVFLGESGVEVAKALEMSHDAVKKRLSRIRARAREIRDAKPRVPPPRPEGV